MNLHHCVPTWNNMEDVAQVPALASILPPPQEPPPPPPSRTFITPSHSTSFSAGPDTSMLDFEMAELTWENGQLTMHGLGIPRVQSKSNLHDAVPWSEKASPRAAGTLESVFNQAYHHHNKGGACDNDDDDQVPWFGPTAPTPVPVTLDALVPRNNNAVGCSTRVGSCSEAARVPLGSDWSVSASASGSIRRKRHAEDTCEQLWSVNTGTNNNGVTSTSFAASPENTKTVTVDDHDSASQSRPRVSKSKVIPNP